MPVIPPEGVYTETELRFIETQPPGLWPENQDSNFGQLRKVLTDEIQARRDEIGMIAAERFPDTADRYLSLWEEMLGAAVNPSGKSEAQRRAVISSRLKYGAFTRPQRDKIIQEFLGTTTGGAPAAFGPSGIPILTGIPLYGSPGAVANLYRVYENTGNFSYVVWIDAANVPDTISLTRELTRVTPAGISFSIDTSHTGTGLIDWGRTVLDLSPTGWWKLAADYNDYSGLAQHGTVVGAPTAITSPGLVLSAGADAARDFSGTAQYVTIVDSAPLRASMFSIHAIVRPDALPSSGARSVIYAINGGNFLAIENVGGTTRFGLYTFDGTNSLAVVSATLPVVGTTYRVIGAFDGTKSHLFVNGVEEGTPQTHSVPLSLAGAKAIGGFSGGTSLWNGGLDEIIVLGYPLEAADALYLNKQATNIL
jgi:hypothetical protein